MKYKIGDYVQVKINGSKQWRYILAINFISPTELEYSVSPSESMYLKTSVKVREKDIICKQMTI